MLVVVFDEVVVEVAEALVDVVTLLELVDVVLAELDVEDVVNDKHDSS